MHVSVNRKFSAVLTFAIMCVSMWVTSLSARVIADISYVPDGKHDQQLDLFLPDSGKGIPIILFIHGGSLTSEDRKDDPYPGIGQAFARCGVACAVISYRLGPENKWPAQPDDCASAFAWLKHHGTEYGADTSRVFVVGHSSGGFLTANLSTDSVYLHKVGFRPSDIAGAVVMGSLLNDHLDTAGVPLARIQKAFETETYLATFGTFEVYDHACPVRLVTKYSPPVLILAADSERFEPPLEASAHEFVDAATSRGAVATYEVLPGRRHITTIRRMIDPADLTTQRILGFIQEVEGQAHKGR